MNSTVKYKRTLKGVDPLSLITNIGGLLTNIFGSGQTYGADFAYRSQQIQGWAQSYGLAGSNAKYINPDVLKSLTTEDPGHPSPYSKNGGVWQADIPQYFQNIQDVLDGRTNSLDYGFKRLAQTYINQVNNGSVSPGTTPIIPTPAGFNLDIPTILLIGAGIYIVTSINKKKKRK